MIKKISMVLLAAILILLYWFSAQDGSQSTKQSDAVLEHLKIETSDRATEKIYTLIIRKSAHVGIYMVIGFLLFTITGSVWQTLIGVFIIACGDELHQYFVPGRSGRFYDVLIDMTGGLLAIIINKFVMRFTKRTKSL